MHTNRFRHVIFFTLMILVISLTVITFGHLLNLVITLHNMLPSTIILGSFLVGIVTYYLYRNHQEQINHEVSRLYTPKVKNIDIPIIHVPLIIFTTLLSHLFGVSVGREGVAVQIGGTIGGYFNKKRQIWDIHIPTRPLLTTAMATGFAALFGMPLTAALFSIEISKLYKQTTGKWLALPFIGSFVASQFSFQLGLSHMHFSIPTITLSLPLFLSLTFLFILILIATPLYLIIHHNLASFLKKYISNPLPRIIIGAISLSFLLFIFKLDSLQGLGSTLISQSFKEQNMITPYLPFLKIIFTLGFLALGFKGGEVTPIFSIGAMIGAVSATAFHLPSPLFAMIGLAAFFGATTKTYIAPLLLAAEVTTPLVIPFLIPILIGIYFLTPKTGIYQKQKTNEKTFKALYR